LFLQPAVTLTLAPFKAFQTWAFWEALRRTDFTLQVRALPKKADLPNDQEKIIPGKIRNFLGVKTPLIFKVIYFLFRQPKRTLGLFRF